MAATHHIQKQLYFARITGELLKRAQQQKEAKEAQDKAIQAIIPEVTKSLMDNERIFDHQQEKVASGLTNPVQALELLRDVARHRTESEVALLGLPVDGTEKRASAPQGAAGARIADFDETDSGRRFRERILGGGA
jgi:hypothetical protein